MVSQVGLGSARSYSSTFTSRGVQNTHVILRSLIGFDTEREKFPKATRYDSFPPRRVNRRRANKRRPPRMNCPDIGRRTPSISSVDFYFPFQQKVATVEEPIMPEQLVTLGVTTTLTIALDPSLDDILLPMTDVPYRDAEIGLNIMAGLLKGITAISEMYSLHATHRVIPLLAKLESYGLLREEGELAAQMWVERAGDGIVDVLHVVFPSRSVANVRAILGESLAQGDWFRIVESKPLTPSETEEMKERWDGVGLPLVVEDDSPAQPDESAMSTLSSVEGSYHGTLDDLPHVDSPVYASSTLTPAMYQAFSAEMDQYDQDQVEELIFPRMEMHDSAMSFEVAEDGLDASVAWSSDLDPTDSEGGSIIWSSPPSEDDDLDSVMSDMEWSGASSPMSPLITRPASPEMSRVSGSGYGILQPW